MTKSKSRMSKSDKKELRRLAAVEVRRRNNWQPPKKTFIYPDKY